MKGYLPKALAIYAVTYIVLFGGWLGSIPPQTGCFPEQLKFLALGTFAGWFVCWVVGLATVYFWAKPVHGALENLGALGDAELKFAARRNLKLPQLAAILIGVLATVYEIIGIGLFMSNDVGAIATSSLPITYLTAIGILPLIVFVMIGSLANARVEVFYQEFMRRGIVFEGVGKSLGRMLSFMLVSVAITAVSWLTANGYFESLHHIKAESENYMLAMQDYAISDLNGGSLDDLKPVVDRLNASGMASFFVADRDGRMLYNPQGAEIFNARWEDINQAVRDGFAANKADSLYENYHEQMLAWTPAGRELVLGSTDSLIKRLKTFGQFWMITIQVLLASLGIMAVVVWALYASLVRPLRNMALRLRDLASGDGDLTVRLPVQTGDEVGQTSEGMNAFIHKLESLMSGITRSADIVRDATVEVASGAQQISGSAQDQAASVEEISATIEQLAATIKHVESSAASGNQKSAEVERTVSSGTALTGEMTGSMAEIHEASQKIKNIITTVNDVAFQTNLLALNAAVEAARAGEHGKGFAVVAAEVRSLAQRSADSSAEIQELISDIVSKVEVGNQKSTQVGEAMQAISAQLGDFTNIMKEIATASTEQSSGVDEINRAITNIDSSTQVNASTVEELASTATNLKQETADLSRSVSRFKVSE